MENTKKVIIDKQYFDSHISDIQAALIELESNKDISKCIETINYECEYLYNIYGIEENMECLTKVIE